MIYHRFLEMLNEDCFDNVMIELYGSSAETIARQKKRYAYALEKKKSVPACTLCDCWDRLFRYRHRSGFCEHQVRSSFYGRF